MSRRFVPYFAAALLAALLAIGFAETVVGQEGTTVVTGDSVIVDYGALGGAREGEIYGGAYGGGLLPPPSRVPASRLHVPVTPGAKAPAARPAQEPSTRAEAAPRIKLKPPPTVRTARKTETAKETAKPAKPAEKPKAATKTPPPMAVAAPKIPPAEEAPPPAAAPRREVSPAPPPAEPAKTDVAKTQPVKAPDPPKVEAPKIETPKSETFKSEPAKLEPRPEPPKKVVEMPSPKQPEPPPPPKVAPPPAAAKQADKPKEIAALPPAGAEGLAAGKPLQVLFGEDSSDLTTVAKGALKGVADMMKAKPDVRLQLLAYADGEGITPSKARRLSLSRALAVRSYLIDNGVRSTRIDVRALGNKQGDGPGNRVDVTIAER
jgi:outer membrane protein OmpA-like peptidoglycan-associated protein